MRLACRSLARHCFALAAALLVFAPAALMAQERPALRIGVQENPPTLEPGREISNVGFRVIYNVFDTLIMVDWRDGEKLIPGLAESWKRIDDKTLEFSLREGVKFHNGDVLTAEDVAFTFSPDRVGEKSPIFASIRTLISNLDRVEAVGPRLVRVVAKTPDPALELKMSSYSTQIISKRGWQEAGSFEAWAKKPIGTGPYRVSEVKDGDFIRLDGFDAYWGGRPNVSTVTFKVIPQVAGRVAALQTGEIDIATDIPPDQFKTIESNPKLETTGGPIKNHRVILFDRSFPALRDVRVRQALALAIDRQAIIDSLWAGRVTVPKSFQWDEFGPLYIADRAPPAYDPARARALLKEAGYAGEPIPYRTTDRYYTAELATAQVLVEMWRAVGLNVQLEIKENATQIWDVNGRAIWNWSNTALYPDPQSVLWRLYGPPSRLQAVDKTWINEEFNAAGRIVESSMDPAARKAAFARMLDVYEQTDPPGTILHRFGMFYGKKKSVKWEPLGNEYMDLRAGNLRIDATP